MKKVHFDSISTTPQLTKFFEARGYEIVEALHKGELLVFTGGPDVNPFLYGERALPGTTVDLHRDKMSLRAWRHGFANDLPMVGICRGAQFLNVMNGGSLWQDVDNHKVPGHYINVEGEQHPILVTSTHHQMMDPCLKKGVVVAYTNKSTIRCSDGWTETNEDIGVKGYEDPEVVWYPGTKSLCVQYHPEYGDTKQYQKGRDLFWDMVEGLIVEEEKGE